MPRYSDRKANWVTEEYLQGWEKTVNTMTQDVAERLSLLIKQAVFKTYLSEKRVKNDCISFILDHFVEVQKHKFTSTPQIIEYLLANGVPPNMHGPIVLVIVHPTEL